MRVWVPYSDWVADVEKLSQEIDVDVYTGEGPPPDTVGEVEFYVAPYTFSPASLEIVREMKSLRVLQLLTAGYEHVLPYVPDGITVCNAGGVHNSSTAELALTLTLSSLRGIPDFVRAQQHGQWVHADYPALADKTVVILGYGSIGESIEQRRVPFEVNVIRATRRHRARPQPEPGSRPESR